MGGKGSSFILGYAFTKGEADCLRDGKGVMGGPADLRKMNVLCIDTPDLDGTIGSRLVPRFVIPLDAITDVRPDLTPAPRALAKLTIEEKRPLGYGPKGEKLESAGGGSGRFTPRLFFLARAAHRAQRGSVPSEVVAGFSPQAEQRSMGGHSDRESKPRQEPVRVGRMSNSAFLDMVSSLKRLEAASLGPTRPAPPRSSLDPRAAYPKPIVIPHLPPAPEPVNPEPEPTAYDRILDES
jgi:hypothetical protein